MDSYWESERDLMVSEEVGKPESLPLRLYVGIVYLLAGAILYIFTR